MREMNERMRRRVSTSSPHEIHARPSPTFSIRVATDAMRSKRVRCVATCSAHLSRACANSSRQVSVEHVARGGTGDSGGTGGTDGAGASGGEVGSGGEIAGEIAPATAGR